MYDTLKMYDKIVSNYFKTIIYLKNQLERNVLEYSKAKELKYILKMMEME